MNRTPSDDQQREPAQPLVQEVRPLLERNRPDVVERVLGRLGDAEPGPQRRRSGRSRARPCCPAARALDLLADDRELPEHRVLDRLLRAPGRRGARTRAPSRTRAAAGTARRTRSRRQRRQAPALVVAELLDHGDRDRQPGVLAAGGGRTRGPGAAGPPSRYPPGAPRTRRLRSCSGRAASGRRAPRPVARAAPLAQDHGRAARRAERDAPPRRSARAAGWPARARSASSTARSTIFISCSAKLAPRQRRRPPPNGSQV